MNHLATIIRSIPTQVLQGKSIMELSKEVNGQPHVIRPFMAGWDMKEWDKDDKRVVERELARRNKRRRKAELRAKTAGTVIPSSPLQNSDGTV